MQKENKEKGEETMYKPVDFSSEKEELKTKLGDLHQGDGESTKEPETINFYKLSKDIEEFIDAASKGLTPFCRHPVQTNTLICLKVFERIKKEKTISRDIIEEFLSLVKQDLGQPSYKYLRDLIFKGDKK